ncbi:hypothetical protein [Luteolibacter luteus]|uniref:Uncharacterized protein n=1 Tax=Luteolibacter luteus TaxID=2728835 RepID=A0A858REB8_9BACT|nr:hypothetical protein [Luteolibacter luteus]QJE94513.1 hypothetical protein HHL09_01505 [Luteolibacter luteus]
MACIGDGMEFFFPGAASISEAHRLHQELAEDLIETTGWAVTPVKVYAVRYRAQEREFLAQVGIVHPPFPDEAPVRAIFDTPAAFLICTSIHGSGGTLPIIVSRSAVSDVEYFNGIHDPVAIR